jgi:hypothetical protein
LLICGLLTEALHYPRQPGADSVLHLPLAGERAGYTPATVIGLAVRKFGMALDDKTVKIVLDERDLPTHWYNVALDLLSPSPAAVDRMSITCQSAI